MLCMLCCRPQGATEAGKEKGAGGGEAGQGRRTAFEVERRPGAQADSRVAQRIARPCMERAAEQRDRERRYCGRLEKERAGPGFAECGGG